MKVSVIIPTYNVENYIEDCLRSIMAQTFTDYECIVVDDLGKDNSIKVAEKVIADYQGEAVFKIIRHERNKGVSAARNTGIKAAEGDYIYFLDSDDKITPEALAHLVQAAEKYPSVNIIQGNLSVQNNADFGQFPPGKFPEYSDDVRWIKSVMHRYGIPICATNRLIRKDWLVANDMFFQEGVIREDVQWYIRLMGIIESMAFVDYECYWYRTENEESIMHGKDRTKEFLSCLEIIKYLSGNMKNNAQLRFLSEFALFELHGIIFNQCKDKQRIIDELRKTTEIVKQNCKQNKNSKKLLLRTLQLLNLPFPAIHNRYFTKAFLEISKVLYPIL